MRCSISHTAVRDTGSRPVVGSSRKKTRGSCTRPRAISTRRRMPPERCLTCLSFHCSSSTDSSSSGIRRRPLVARHAVQLGVDQQVLLDAQLEVARHRLRNDADRAPHVIRLLDDVEAADERGAGRRRKQRDEHPDQRGFAGAVRTEQPEDLALLDGEADAVDGGEVAELLDDRSDVDGVAS